MPQLEINYILHNIFYCLSRSINWPIQIDPAPSLGGLQITVFIHPPALVLFLARIDIHAELLVQNSNHSLNRSDGVFEITLIMFLFACWLLFVSLFFRRLQWAS